MPDYFDDAPAGGPDFAARLAHTGLTEADYRRHTAILDEHGGSNRRARCPIHGTRGERMCDERVAAWTVLAEARFLEPLEP